MNWIQINNIAEKGGPTLWRKTIICWQFCGWLNSGEKMTAKQMSEKLEINIRTVYRHIDALCASGVPIIADAGHNGGYTLLNNFIKAPLLFDIEEKRHSLVLLFLPKKLAIL